MKKNNTLSAGLRAAAGRRAVEETPASKGSKGSRPPAAETVLIGAHFNREVRRALLLVQAEPENAGKNLKQLLGEAINDLCSKYGKPQPWSGEA